MREYPNYQIRVVLLQTGAFVERLFEGCVDFTFKIAIFKIWNGNLEPPTMQARII